MQALKQQNQASQQQVGALVFEKRVWEERTRKARDRNSLGQRYMVNHTFRFLFHILSPFLYSDSFT